MKQISTRIYVLFLLISWLLSVNIAAQTMNNIAPDFTVQHKDGYNIDFKTLRSKYVYLNFWASWCPVSTIQVPNLRALYDKYSRARLKQSAGGFEIMSVSLEDNRDTWLKTLNSYGDTWKFHCIDTRGFESPVARLYGITTLPSSFLINPSGMIVLKDPSFAELDDYLSAQTESFNTTTALTSLSEPSITAQPIILSGENRGNYQIFIGSFGIPNFHNFEKIASIGEVSVMPANNVRENVYIGHFSSYDEAALVLQKIKAQGYTEAKVISGNINSQSVAQGGIPSTVWQQPTTMNVQSTATQRDNTYTKSPPIGVSETYVSYSGKQYGALPLKTYTPANTATVAPKPNTYHSPTPNKPTIFNPSSIITTHPTTTTPKETSPAPTTRPATPTANPANDKDNNVWTIRPNTNPTSAVTTPPPPSTPSTTPTKSGTWMQELEKRGLNRQYTKSLPNGKALQKEREKLRKKRERLMQEVEAIKKQEDSIEEQLQFRSMYE